MHFECSDFNFSTRVTVYAECILFLYVNRIFEIFQHTHSSFDKMFVALKRAGCCLVAFGGSKCCLFALKQARSRSHSPHSSVAWLMTVCGMPDQVSVRRCLRSAVSRTEVL